MPIIRRSLFCPPVDFLEGLYHSLASFYHTHYIAPIDVMPLMEVQLYGIHPTGQDGKSSIQYASGASRGFPSPPHPIREDKPRYLMGVGYPLDAWICGTAFGLGGLYPAHPRGRRRLARAGPKSSCLGHPIGRTQTESRHGIL